MRTALAEHPRILKSVAQSADKPHTNRHRHQSQWLAGAVRRLTPVEIQPRF